MKTPPRQSPPISVRAFAPTVEVLPQVATTLSPIGCAATDGKDILFVFDGTVNFRQSYDESQKEFKKIRNFIKAVVRDLDDERFRVGVMQYSGKDTATMEIDFMSPTDLAEIKIRLATIVQQGGYERYIGEALVKANHQVLCSSLILGDPLHGSTALHNARKMQNEGFQLVRRRRLIAVKGERKKLLKRFYNVWLFSSPQ